MYTNRLFENCPYVIAFQKREYLHIHRNFPYSYYKNYIFNQPKTVYNKDEKHFLFDEKLWLMVVQRFLAISFLNLIYFCTSV